MLGKTDKAQEECKRMLNLTGFRFLKGQLRSHSMVLSLWDA